MVCSFLYQPHVYQSANTIVTPDIVVETAYLLSANGKTQVPISRLTSRLVVQRCSHQSPAVPSLVFIAAGHGVLVTVSSFLKDVIVVARQALRCSQLMEVWNNSKLYFQVTHGGTTRLEKEIDLSTLIPVHEIEDILGHPPHLRAGTAVFITDAQVNNDVDLCDYYEVGVDSSVGALNLRIKIENIR